MSTRKKTNEQSSTSSAKNEIFYVGVQDPAECRKDILESTRALVLMLQSYHAFKKVREQKELETKNLKDVTKQIEVLISKLKRELPKTRLREKAPAAEQTQTTAKQHRAVPAQEKPQRRHMNEVERLETELADIERKLNILG